MGFAPISFLGKYNADILDFNFVIWFSLLNT